MIIYLIIWHYVFQYLYLTILTYLMTELRIYLIIWHLPMRSHNNDFVSHYCAFFLPIWLCLMKSHSVVLFHLFIFKNHFFRFYSMASYCRSLLQCRSIIFYIVWSFRKAITHFSTRSTIWGVTDVCSTNTVGWDTH